MPETGQDRLTPDELSDQDIYEAALSDPDAQPLTDEQLARMVRSPRPQGVRRLLGLTQEQFAERYAIPLATLRDWEGGVAQPDAPSRAYLRAIAGDPEAVFRALHARREAVAGVG